MRRGAIPGGSIASSNGNDRALSNNHNQEGHAGFASLVSAGVSKRRHSKTIFVISDDKIPHRNARIKPEMSRSYLNALPEHYEKAKLRNVVTRSLRRVADDNKQVFGTASQVYTM